ncbi:site-specific recombinase XerD [Novosphingobium sp. PhB165]|uniref:tyrosine-type recombinase/integrase n=1 Tax=Novosphingobium sp. PhB165 TaxID=2485105 RepID=UPI0010434529|nr:tyrosine-type recombinase/integrase [Novosphingobium sp. PhB165]TCM17252.1 site-specific recombinase XerD [Novosphingobium sp. PhB165]
MSRETSPLIVGDFWLDKRRDGKSPDIWQIATASGRTIVYRSTKCRDVGQPGDGFAGDKLREHEAASRSKQKQGNDQAELVPHLFHYLREHGPDIHRIDTVKSSFRAWIGFFQQDEVTTGVRVAEMTKGVIARFRRWRMSPHGWKVEWGGKLYEHNSKGVSGEAVQRNIEDLRAALNHAAGENRIDAAPKIPSVDKKLRSKPRRLVLTPMQIGAIVAYADHEPDVQAWIRLMIGTAVRPDAGLAFDPAAQWRGAIADMHPVGAPITNKRNPIIPVIEPLQAVLKAWPDGPKVKSRKIWWRTMRSKLGLPEKVIPKTIRHTVASHLRNSGVPGEQISHLLGHKDKDDTLEATSEIYAHVDPLKMAATVRALTKFWKMVEREAVKWRADHLLTITDDNNKILTPRKG